MADTSKGNIFNDIDVTTLTQQEASDYRHELKTAIYNPGIEFDILTRNADEDLKFFYRKLAEADVYLATFPEKI
jgi:hypothetical protein